MAQNVKTTVIAKMLGCSRYNVWETNRRHNLDGGQRRVKGDDHEYYFLKKERNAKKSKQEG